MDFGLNGSTTNLNNINNLNNVNLNNNADQPVFIQPGVDQVCTLNNIPVQETLVTNQPIEKVPEGKPIMEEEQPVIHNKLTLKTEKILELMNNILKAITYDSRIALSTVTQIKFTKNGLELTASNGSLFIIQKDLNNKYTQEISICIDTKLFRDLLSKIKDEEIELSIDAQAGLVIVKTSSSEFTLKEQYDPNNHIKIDIPIPNDMFEAPTFTINNIPELQEIMTSMIGFTPATDGIKSLQGVYFDGNTISATDRNNVAIRQTTPEFKNKTVFLSRAFVQAFKDIDFGTTAEFGIVTDAGMQYPTRTIIKSDKACVIGLAKDQDEYAAYPITVINDFENLTFAQTAKLNKASLLNALDCSQLFINSQERDLVEFQFNGNNITLKSLSGTAICNIAIQETLNVSPRRLYVRKLIELVNLFDGDTIELRVDPEKQNMIGMSTESLTTIMAVDQG